MLGGPFSSYQTASNEENKAEGGEEVRVCEKRRERKEECNGKKEEEIVFVYVNGEEETKTHKIYIVNVEIETVSSDL